MIFLLGLYYGVVGTIIVQQEINKKPCVVDAQTQLCMVLKEKK